MSDEKQTFDIVLDLIQATALFAAAERDLTIPAQNGQADPLAEFVARYGRALAVRDFDKASSFYKAIALTQDEGSPRRAQWKKQQAKYENFAQGNWQADRLSRQDKEDLAAALAAQAFAAAPGSEQEYACAERFEHACGLLTQETPLGGVFALIPFLDKARKENRKALQAFAAGILIRTAGPLLEEREDGSCRLDEVSSCAVTTLPQALADAVMIHTKKGSLSRENAVYLLGKSLDRLSQQSVHEANFLSEMTRQFLKSDSDTVNLHMLEKVDEKILGRLVPSSGTFRPMSLIKRFLGRGEG